MIKNQEVTEELPHDKKLGEIYRILADSVCEDLKFTTDCPSDNPNGRVPILDTEMWIEDLEDDS